MVNNIPLTTSFTYDSAGSGELTQVTYPYGGHIRWAYGPFTYSGSRILREVSGGRFLSTSTGAAETTYTIGFSPDANTTFHLYSYVDDPDGQSEKAFNLGTNPALPSYGLLASKDNRPHHNPNTAGGRYETYTWTTDPAGNPYIGTALITEDHLNPGEISKKTVQALDQYGNVTQMQIFDYGFGAGAARTYTNTYQSASAYTSLYIFNRLLTSTVTDGTHTTTLANNSYDQTLNVTATGIFEHSSQYDTTWRTRGNPTTIVSPSGTTTVVYDIAGNVTLTNVNGLVTSNTLNTTTNYAAPSAITTNSLSSSMNYTAALDLSSAAGPNGDTLGIAYDANNRPQTTTAPTGAVTTFTYNDSASPPTKVATTNSHWVRTTMDGLGRTTKTETGNGATTVSTVDTVYVPCGCSPLGKMGQQSAPYAPAAPYIGQPTPMTAWAEPPRSSYPTAASRTTPTRATRSPSATRPLKPKPSPWTLSATSPRSRNPTRRSAP